MNYTEQEIMYDVMTRVIKGGDQIYWERNNRV